MKIQQKWLKPLLSIYWPLCFILTHLRLPTSVAPRPGMDKAYHLIGYFLLGFLIKSNFAFKGKFRNYPVTACLIVIGVYSLFDEVTQPFFGRQFDFLDIAADLIGATLGAWASRRIYPVK